MSADTRALAQAIIDALAPFVADEAPAKKARGGKVTEDDHKPMALVEDDVEAEEVTEYTEAELKKMKVKDLRTLAISLDYDEAEVKDASKAELVTAILADQEGDVEPVEDIEGEDEDIEVEDEDEALDSEYEGMSLAELKAEAKKAGIDGRKIRHMDRDEIIALLTDVEEEDEDFEDEDEDEDAEDDEAWEFYTEDELNDLPLSELKDVAADYELDVPKRTRRNTIVQMILDAQDEMDEEED